MAMLKLQYRRSCTRGCGNETLGNCSYMLGDIYSCILSRAYIGIVFSMATATKGSSIIKVLVIRSGLVSSRLCSRNAQASVQ